MEHDELTQKVIGCAFRVGKVLGAGFLESVYEKAMLVELRKLGVHAESQVAVKVVYENVVVGNFIADIVVEGAVIVELKAIRELAMIHEVQLVNYLKATNVKVGLLINFAEDGKIEVKRKFRDYRSKPAITATNQ